MTRGRILDAGEHTEGQTANAKSDSLREATFSGVRWVAAARVGGEVLAFAGAIALARLVSPAEFGRAAVALAFVPLAVILTFEGCASALVQRPKIEPAHVHGAMLLSLVRRRGAERRWRSCSASTLGDAVFGDRTGELIELVAPVFMLASVGATSRALMWRRLDFRQVSVIEVLGLLIGTATAVGLALAGLDGKATDHRGACQPGRRLGDALCPASGPRLVSAGGRRCATSPPLACPPRSRAWWRWRSPTPTT